MKNKKRNLASLRRLRIRKFPSGLLLFATAILVGISGFYFYSETEINAYSGVKPYSVTKKNTNGQVLINNKTESIDNENQNDISDTDKPEQAEIVENKPSVEEKDKNETGVENIYNSQGKNIKRILKNTDGKITKVIDFYCDTVGNYVGQEQKKYDLNENVIEKAVYKLKDGQISLDEKIKYNSTGEITEKAKYKSIGGKTLLAEKGKYGASGKITEKERYKTSGEKALLEERIKYSSNGNVEEKSEYKSTNGKALLAEKVKYGANGKITEREKYKQDGEKALLEEKIKYSSNGNIEEKAEYKTDTGKSYMSKKTEYDTSGKITKVTNFHYDTSENLVSKEENKYSSSGIITEKNEYKKTGENFRLAEKTLYNEAGKIASTEKYDYSGGTLTSKKVTAYTSYGDEIGFYVLKYSSSGKVIYTERSSVELDCGVTLTFVDDVNLRYKNSDGFGNNINGDIDEPTAQGKTGDCWFVSAINALSYTASGRNALKNAIRKNTDGSVTVTFRGARKSYTISASDLEKAEKSNLSNGDDDMMVLEIATILLFRENKIAERDSRVEDDTTYITGDVLPRIYSQFGLESKLETNLDDKKLDAALDYFSESHNIVGHPYHALNFSWHPKGDKKIELECIDGKIRTLFTGHAYAVKEVTGNSVTFINPWDSEEDITVSRDTFKSIQKSAPGYFYIYYGVQI